MPFLLHSLLTSFFMPTYKSKVPKAVNPKTIAPIMNGVASFGLMTEFAALLWVEVEVEDEVAVTDACPLPAVAVPEELIPSPEASWEPVPVRPGPVPAPVFMYAAAFSGIDGRTSEVTFQVEEKDGQTEAADVELYPPSPDGLEVPARAVFRESN